MKTYLSLIALIILLPFTGFTQDVDQARWHLEQALELLEESEQPIDSFSVVSESPNIFKASWFANQSGEGDIEYGTGGFDYSYKANISAIPLQDNQVTIGVGRQALWQFRFVAEDWISDTLYVSNVLTGDDPLEERYVNFGMWNHSDYGNVTRAWVGHVPDVAENRKVIPTISGFRSDETEHRWRQRFRTHADVLRRLDPKRVPFIIIRDEPYFKNFTGAQLERLIEIAREEIGDQFSYTYSFARAAIEAQQVLPQNTQIIAINFYPFYLESCDWCEKVRTEQEFYEFFDEIMNLARQNSVPGTTFSITGQAFYDVPDGRERWREPPAEAPFWYMDYIQRNPDITTLLWFFENSNQHWVGTDGMPEFKDNLNRAFQSIPAQ